MENLCLYSRLLLLLMLLFVPTSFAQLIPQKVPKPVSKDQLIQSKSRILFQIQQLLEYPPALQDWNNWTNFCYLPQSPSLTIVCSGDDITELTIVGNKTNPSQITKSVTGNLPVLPFTLSESFSLDSFFTVLTKLSSLTKLSLVSLGLWGSLPGKIDRFDSLQVLNLSSNFIYGRIPPEIANCSDLRSLVLADNLFNGSVPDLTGLKQLQELDLSGNPIGSNLPHLSSNVVRINFRNMSLRSQIPADFAKLIVLQFLDISYNKLQGPIPSFVFSLPSIQYINLAKNQLSGALPLSISCNQNLSFVDVSSNLLIGKLPPCLGSNSGKKTVIFIWNCLSNTTSKYQRPTSFCQKQALAVKPSAIKHKQQSKIEVGLLIGIIFGVVAIISCLGVLILVMFKRLERNRATRKDDGLVLEKGSTRAAPKIDARNVPWPMRMVSLGLPPYQVFTLEEIEDATSNFDPVNLVVEGHQDQLYRGWLRDGSVVLVKCLKLKQKHSPQSLQQHIEVVSKLRHRHIVSVLGHCIVTYQDHPNMASTVFLVIESVANGSLKDHLADWRKKEVLKWPQRMGIAMSVAKGIQFLHTAGIIGNNLKIESILLDETLTPKISGYNMALPSKVGLEDSSQETQHHFMRFRNNEQDDIFQLGIALLEVITGRQINSQTELNDQQSQLEMGLGESVSKLKDVTDLSIRGTFAYESLKTVAQITVNCLNEDANKRPSIEDILWHLQYSVQVQEGWTSSGNLSTKP